MRETAPIYQDIQSVEIVRPNEVLLDNGIPLYTLHAGTQDVIKIILLFNAGSLCQPAPLVAFATNSMLIEGTINRSAAEISELSDYYGAYITCATDKDTATVTLLCLRKHLHQMLPLLGEVVMCPSFPDNEMQSFIGRHSQQFLVEQSKSRNIAQKKFVKALFGNGHPYGYELQLTDFQNLDTAQLSQFYTKNYHAGNCRIVASGNVQESDILAINRYLGSIDWKKNDSISVPHHTIKPELQLRQHIDKQDSVQSSVRLGLQTCNKLHDDFSGLTVVNTLLGGYFGSRLMQNIREDKGYTYGVNSLLVSLREAGYMTIIMDTGKEVTQAAVSEIYKEIERLQQDLVPAGELQLVKTYLMSEMLRSFDGPFAQAESLIALLEYGLDAGYYERYMEYIRNIDSKKIQALTQHYLDIHRIYEIVVG